MIKCISERFQSLPDEILTKADAHCHGHAQVTVRSLSSYIHTDTHNPHW